MPLMKSKNDQEISQNERKTDRNCNSLALNLCNPDPLVRRWAARDLADCDGASAPLVEQLLRETDTSVRTVIFSSLTQLGDQTAVDGLVTCLSSEDVATRNEAIEAMQQLPDKVASIMQNLLNDPNSNVRIFAVNVLESLRHPDVEAWLIDVIENDSEVNVCATAVDLLSEVGTDNSILALRRLKARFPVEPFIQFATDIALKRIEEE